MKIAVTGHRPNKLGHEWNVHFKDYGPISKWIYEELESICLAYKPDKIISGMALGVDMIWATVATRLDIPFIAAIPCVEQYKKWNLEAQKRWRDIVNHPLCTQYYVTDTVYRPDCMQKRNEWMVDNCDMLIAVWDGTSGGTANCIKYAEKIGKKIIYIYI